MSSRKKQNQSFTSMNTIPAILLIGMGCAIVLFKQNWWWVVATGLFLFCRWLYFLPTGKRRKEYIESEQQNYIQRKKYKQEYEARKKLLGRMNNYSTHEAYWAKYTELGMAPLEKELMLGIYAPKQRSKKIRYGVGSLLYDFFLGTGEVEKKSGFSSTQSQGYTGENTGGQSAGDYGGGSSGGGGATS